MNAATITAIGTAAVAIITAVITLVKTIKGTKTTNARLNTLETNGTSNVGANPNVGSDGNRTVFPESGTD